MTTDAIALLTLIALIAVLVWARSRRRPAAKQHEQSFRPDTDRSLAKRPYVLKAGPAPDLIAMPEATSRLFTYQDERHAAKARQRLWICYEDRSGTVTERAVEIYQPEDDEYIFSWCCSKLEPRTFARRSIQRWRLLPERFEFDPIVNQYWEEEGTRDMSEKMPWRRWLAAQPDHIAHRYS
jgi:predicted DNA-binding transcriptional regulator YafY